MKLSRVGELSLLDILRKRFSIKSEGLLVGIGDDSAAVRPNTENLLLTTDMMVEDVHFSLSWMTPYQLGFKLISVNVSDIYAMGGLPKYILLNFSASDDCTTAFFQDFLNGVEMALKFYGVSLIGGDLSSSEKIVLSATALGYAQKVIRRKGARVGDSIYVTGHIGDSSCGLALLKLINQKIPVERNKKCNAPLKWDIMSPLIKRHLLPIAKNPGHIQEYATSMIDISDGLFIDLSRLCTESGVGARINTKDISVSDELIKAASFLNTPVLEFVAGGEDYELLFTAPAGLNNGVHCIGEVTKSGLLIINEEGRPIKLPSKGYQHFKR